MLYLVASLLLAGTTVFVLALTCLTLELRRRLPPTTKGTVAIFHPYANGGGGGERVLWCAIQALQAQHLDVQVVLYCGDLLSPAQYAELALDKFNIHVAPDFQVVCLGHLELLEPSRYPTFTLVGQAWGSLRLAWRALQALRPEVWVDTAGWAATYPLARIAGCGVAAYVHYPMVSSDMMGRVAKRSSGFNNAQGVAASLPRTAVKLAYYLALMLLYGFAGRCTQVSMANSSWTQAHIRKLWGSWPHLVYPPVDTASLQELPLDRKLKRLFLISVAQFRPEKVHLLQLQALALARQEASRFPSSRGAQAVLAARLKLVGSCRGPADQARVEKLREAAEQLGLAQHVDFCLGVSNQELRSLLGDAVGGLHTMLDEHFGISVVEYMAAGVIPVAHDSAGPSMDIVVPACGVDPGRGVGFLCRSEGEYAEAIQHLLAMPQEQRLEIAARARRKASQFSDARFVQEFTQALQPALARLRRKVT